MSSESEGILENDLVEAVEPPVPDYVHIFSRMWASIPAELCSGSFPLDVYEDSSLTLPEDKIITMDGVSKCWKTLDPDSDSLLIQEPDGITWAICEECVSQIPKEIQHALYFFHSLLCHVQDFAKYALPSDNILFHKERKRSKVVSKLLWSRVERIPASSVDRDNSDIDMTSEMQQRSTMRDGNIVSEVPALKMRLAVTGARYKHNEQEEKKTFAVLFVTFARNFDGLSYIRDCFLNPVYHPKTDRVPELDLIWKRMICFVAFNNLGLDCNRLRQPENFCDDPCGEMGVDSLMNIFQIPMQIYGAIKNSLDGGVISDVRIAGMPQLRFGRDEMTRDYIEYMHQYIDVVSDFRTKMQKALDKFNVEKKKKDDEEEEEEEPMPELFCIGAWPLACNSQGKFCRWGLPKLPIFMNFEPMFKVEPNERFKYWLVSVDGANGIPELVKTCLRFYMVSVDESVSHIAWDHFLTNRKRANRSLVLQKYYSDRANPMSALVLPGYLREWWFNFKKDIRSDRERGADVLSVCCKFQRYLKSVMLNHKSTMESNAYMSEKITQAASIIEKLNFAQISHEGDDAIMTLFHETMNGMSHSRRHDRYQVCNEMFWRTWENLNRSFKINCSNLAFLMEMMVSRVFWMTGATNETWSAYFQAIQIKSGNGHYRVTNKDGVFDDQRKPNSSGMDFTHARFCELDQAILDRVGCTESQQNLQCPVNCTGWTYASIPLQTHATMSEGKIETLPDENVAYRSFIATEVRDMPIGALIHNFPRNADGLEQFKLNTCDPDKTNKRKSRVQVMIQPLHFVALSTNVPSRNEQQSEEWRTLSAVIATMPPGSGPYTKKQKVGEFNDRVCNVFGSRQSKPERIDLIANVLSYSNIWASCMGALINMSGAITYEINPAVLGYLDWLFYYVREDVNGLLERFVNQSFQRMKEGYEARQVAKSIWTQAIPNIAFAKNSDEAVIKHMHSLMCHTLPVAEVPAAVHSFLCRGINMGAAMMVVVCAKHLQVPIIPLQQLCNFFNQETITSDADQETANVIKLWLDHSKRSNRFCVEDDMFNSMTMYISSDADVSQNPLVDKICMLRVKKSRVQGDNVCQAVGVRVKDLYGLELNETCHMGPEPSIYANGLMCLLGEWMPDFRQLYSKYIYAHERHCKKMRFAEWKASDWDEDECPPFARIFTVRDRANNEVSSYAMGINIWGLLLMVSLGATTLHPQVVGDISRTILRDLLHKTPANATPGNMCMIRSFQLKSTKAQRILVPSQNRPKHFLRPLQDENFFSTGEFAYAKNVDKFMPEDVMHCGFLFSMRKIFSCGLLEIPGRLVQAEYEIVADTAYSIWNPLTRHKGFLMAQSVSGYVLIHNYTTEEGQMWPYLNWQEKLQVSDFVILPMIFRAGACVYHSEFQLGVLVPWSSSQANFDQETGLYQYYMDETKTPHTLDAVEVMEKLVVVGTELFIDINDPYFSDLIIGVVPQHMRTLRYLYVRLNVPSVANPPTDKVYVTYLLQNKCTGANTSTSKLHSIAVDPWKLLVTVDGEEYLPHLIF